MTLLIAIALTLLVYRGSIPQRYLYKVGDFSEVDIFATRDITDAAETQSKAKYAELQVEKNPIYKRSEEISQDCNTNVNRFFSIVSDIRKGMMNEDRTVFNYSYAQAGEKIRNEIFTALGMELTVDESFALVNLDDTNFRAIQSRSVSAASLILLEQVFASDLPSEIDRLTVDEVESNPSSTSGVTNSEIVKKILTSLLRPNTVIDEEATEASKLIAYNGVINDPVMIEKGARIVSRGQRITQDDFDLLSHLGMIETSTFDFRYLLGLFVYCSFVLTGLLMFVFNLQKDFLRNKRILIAIALSEIITFFSAIYLSDISPLLIPVYFSSVIISIYLGRSPGLVFSVCQIILMLPVSGFDPEFFYVSVVGCSVCCFLGGDRKQKFSAALLILLTGGLTTLASVFYNFLLNASLTKIATSATWAAISGITSVILATGLMPIFELISNSISPIRLIDLSQPGNLLQKRLFMEAPGTYQHSMMVANLADSAAEAIGANALLAKVGAYYHDIGKLENPEYFTENQNGDNPHDLLTPEESCDILLAHPENGVRLARRYRLPMGVIRFIQEHHGTTFQSYFYHKAKEIAIANGEAEPPVQMYKYKGPTPSNQESAIVMLADTCEAAIKSTGIKNLTEAQDLFRKLIKQKIEQDQLVNSKLSFTDLEIIIRSFLQVYAGVFHERIRYPDESSNR